MDHKRLNPEPAEPIICYIYIFNCKQYLDSLQSDERLQCINIHLMMCVFFLFEYVDTVWSSKTASFFLTFWQENESSWNYGGSKLNSRYVQ